MIFVYYSDALISVTENKCFREGLVVDDDVDGGLFHANFIQFQFNVICNELFNVSHFQKKKRERKEANRGFAKRPRIRCSSYFQLNALPNSALIIIVIVVCSTPVFLSLSSPPNKATSFICDI